MARSIVTPEQIDQMTEYREAGKSTAWIARKLGLKLNTVDYHLRRLGVFPPGWTLKSTPVEGGSYWRNGHLVRAFTPEDDALLLSLESQGLGFTAIGKRMGRKPNTIRARLTSLANQAALTEEAV